MSQAAETELLSAVAAAERNFSTNNIVGGGCVECACEVMVHYHYDDGIGVPNAPFVMTDAKKNEYTGKTDANGLFFAQNIACGSFDILFDEGEDDFTVNETVANNPVLQANPHYAALATEYLVLYDYLHQKGHVSQSSGGWTDWGDADISHDIADTHDWWGDRTVSAQDEKAINRFRELASQIEKDNGPLEAAIIKTHHQLAGEVSDNSMVIMMVAEIILGCIPVVGQALDVKDCAIWLYDGVTGAEGADFTEPLYLGLGVLNVIGFVPGFGDAIKKTLQPVLKFLGKASDIAGATRAIRSLSNGNLIRHLKGLAGKLATYGRKAVELVKKILSAITKLVQKASTWLPSSITRILRQVVETVRKLDGWIKDSISRLKGWIDEFIGKIFTKKSGTSFKKGQGKQAKLNAGADKTNNGSRTSKNKKPSEKTKNKKPCGDCGPGNPVDAITGQVIEHRQDITLPSTPPLQISRHYHPEHRGGLFGAHWRSNLDTQLAIEDDGYYYHAEDHSVTHYYDPEPGEQNRNLKNPGIRLARTLQGALYLLHQDGIRHYYGYALGRNLHLSAIEDRNGNRIDIQRRPSDGFPIGMHHSNGQHLYFSGVREQDELDLRISQIRYQVGQARQQTLLNYHYDEDQRLQKITGELHHTGADYRYNATGQITQRNDQLRQTWTRYYYNDQGKVSHQDSAGEHYNGRFSYAPGHTRYHQPGGGEVDYYYDSQQRITAIENCRGGRTENQWEQHNLIGQTDPLGRDTQTTYDDWGEALQIDHPDGRTEKIARNEAGQPIRYTDSAGASWHYRYDTRGNLTRITDPLGHSEHHHYNALGQNTASRSPGGSKQRRRYDQNGHLSQYQGPDGNQHHYTYDGQGRLTQYRDPEGHQQTWSYTGTQPQPSSATDALGHQQHWQNNALGQIEHSIDANGQRTHYEWGPYGTLHRQTDPLGNQTTYQYGPHARLQTITRPNGDTWQQTYDTAGNLSEQQDYSGAKTRNDYDLAERLIRERHPDGSQTTYAYDDGDRLIEKTQHPAKAAKSELKQTRYRYDAAGRLQQAENAETTITYERDLLGRIIQETHPDHSLQHQYNADGQRITLAGEQYQTTWDYSQAQQLQTQHNGAHAPLHYDYDRNGRETSRISDAGYGQHQRYEARGLLTEQRAGIRLPEIPGLHSHAPNIDRDHHYDPAGQLTRQDDHYWGKTHYQHDPNGQITKVQIEKSYQTTREHYSYNNNQDLRTVTQQQPTSDHPQQATALTDRNDLYHYQRGGRIQRTIQQHGHTQYHYDAKGRLQTKTEQRNGFRPQTWTYHWDGEDQLRQLDTPQGETWNYAYDPFGRRIRKQRQTTDNLTQNQAQNPAHSNRSNGTAYRWDGDHLIQTIPYTATDELNWQHTTHYYYNDVEEVIAQQQNDTAYYINSDLNGLPRALLDETGSVQWRAQYNLWGEQLEEHPSQSQPASELRLGCDLRFQGQIYDAESGLHYNRYRYYDPNTAQYLSSDPIGLAGGLRTQGYVHNPNTWIDPLGLSDRMPNWMPTKRGYERHHIIPSSLKNHPAMQAANRAGMNINGATNMQYLPVAEGIHPSKSLHKGWSKAHADYNSAIKSQLDDIKRRSRIEKWNDENIRKEVLKLQKRTRSELNCGCLKLT